MNTKTISSPLAATPRAPATLPRHQRSRNARSRARKVSAATTLDNGDAFFPISKPVLSRPLLLSHAHSLALSLSHRHRELVCASASADATTTDEEMTSPLSSSVDHEIHHRSHRGEEASTSTSTTSSPTPSTSSPALAADLESASSPLNSAFLLAATKRQWKKLLLAGLCLVCCVAMNLSSPVLAGRIFDSIIREAANTASTTAASASKGKAGAALAAATTTAQSSAFLTSLAVLAFTYTFEPLLTRLYISTAVSAAEGVLSSARVELFRCLLAKKISFFDASPPASLARAAADDLDTLRAVALSSTARDRGPRAALEATGAVIVLAWLSWRLGPVLAVVIGATAAAAALHRLRTKPLERAATVASDEMHAVAARALGSMPTVRSFGAERGELLRFSRAAAASSSAARGFGDAKGTLEAMSRGAVHASLLLLYGLGGHLVRRGLMPAGVLLSAVGFTYSLVYATQGFVQTLADCRRARAALERVRTAASGARLGGEKGTGGGGEGAIDWPSISAPDPEVLATLPSSEECLSLASSVATGGREASTAPTLTTTLSSSPLEDIKFEGVHFSYPTRPAAPVLRGLSLDLPAGSVTALVGPSGAGKSTVAALLSRFYEPCSGSITLGGRDISRVPFEVWTRSVSLVPQEVSLLFDATIAENIAYGRVGGELEEAEVVAAAKAARAHDFISSLPQGYQTRVGGSSSSSSSVGVTLSGGQRQRIAIARALFKSDARLVIVDEHTSSLDTATAVAASAAALRELLKGRTVLMIAHRLSTIQSADRIAVVEGGKVVELGTHAELVKVGGAYSRLVQASMI